MKNTSSLLALIQNASHVEWMRWDGDAPAPVGGYTQDGNIYGPINALQECTTSPDELLQALRAGTTAYLTLAKWLYVDAENDYENETDPENVHYLDHEDALTEEFADWVVSCNKTDYHAEEKIIAVRLGMEVPDDAYDFFAAVLADMPEPQPL